MTSTHATPSASEPGRGYSRLRRWLIVLLVVGVLLAVYALALQWASEELGEDMLDSMREVPVIEDVHHKPPGG